MVLSISSKRSFFAPFVAYLTVLLYWT
uniref:Uncharacterized protein n=1 Tax=Tetranychus urticae TaxID=32264 RepID=T1JX77_TETUR